MSHNHSDYGVSCNTFLFSYTDRITDRLTGGKTDRQTDRLTGEYSQAFFVGRGGGGGL